MVIVEYMEAENLIVLIVKSDQSRVMYRQTHQRIPINVEVWLVSMGM